MGKVYNCDTVSKLAAKNSKDYKSQLEEAAAKRKEEAPPPPKKEWYQDDKFGGATPKEINKMSRNQQVRYIMEGRK